LLALEAVGKRYGRGPAVLSDITFAARPGEIAAIVGGNGSGKSTLLRILAGVSRPTSGRRVGEAVVGYVPDRFPSTSRLSAESYLRHLGRIRGLSAADSAARAGELLDRLDLVGAEARVRTPLRALSKGNAQKVAVAQALMVAPEVLILDEPWSGLDASAHGVLDEILRETARGGSAVVVTDHREQVAGAGVWRLAEGRLTAGGRIVAGLGDPGSDAHLDADSDIDSDAGSDGDAVGADDAGPTFRKLAEQRGWSVAGLGFGEKR
jgi:ABC-type multidrug transport system ATPase subunit